MTTVLQTLMPVHRSYIELTLMAASIHQEYILYVLGALLRIALAVRVIVSSARRLRRRPRFLHLAFRYSVHIVRFCGAGRDLEVIFARCELAIPRVFLNVSHGGPGYGRHRPGCVGEKSVNRVP